MNSRKAFLVLFALVTAQFLFGITERNILQKEATIEKLKKELVTDKSWIKYPDYSDRTGWDNFLGEFKNEYIKRGEKSLKHEWKAVRATDYIEYFRSGNRTNMQDKYNENIYAIMNLFLAELAEGKGRFTEPLMDLVFSACEMTSWSISAHVTLQKTYKRFPLPDDYAVELVSTDFGALLSWIHYYMKDEFDKVEPMVSKRLSDEIYRRIITPYMNNNHYWWLGFELPENGLLNNWNPWCNSNVLQTMMLMENDPEKLANEVYRTMLSIDKYMNFVNADGACDEGPSYWAHAGGKLYDYLALLYDATNGGINIFENPMIKNMGEYISRSYVGNNWVVNFADAVAQLKPDYNLIYRYGKAVKSNEMMEFAAYLKSINPTKGVPNEGREIGRLFETLRHKDELVSVTQKHKSPSYTWYPETQFCYMNGMDIFVAMKGGHNNESHNHNDVGTFTMWIENEPVFIDAGVGTYTRQTFSSERYNIWSMQSQYHNLPVIDGKSQVFGRTNKATNVKFDHKKSTFSLDINSAYPELNKNSIWNRQYTLKGNMLTIKDKFTLHNPAAPNEINFLTRGTVENFPGKIIVEVNGKKAQMTFNKNDFSIKTENIQLTDKRLSDVWGDKIYRITLKAKDLKKSGLYEYKITKL